MLGGGGGGAGGAEADVEATAAGGWGMDEVAGGGGACGGGALQGLATVSWLVSWEEAFDPCEALREDPFCCGGCGAECDDFLQFSRSLHYPVTTLPSLCAFLSNSTCCPRKCLPSKMQRYELVAEWEFCCWVFHWASFWEPCL